MAIVSGDNWHHSSLTPYVEGIEYFNYSDFDITITDKLGIEIEILRASARPERLEDRGKVIARVTRLVDPRRVSVPSTDALLPVDQVYLETFKDALEIQKKRIALYESEHTQIRVPVQAEIRLDFYVQNTVTKSNLLGITVRATNNIVEKSYGDTPDGYINNIIIPELREVDETADEGKDKGIRTLFSARLIDNNNRLGTLWTSGFGEVTRIIPVKDEEQEEGLYLAGGLGLKYKRFVSVEELMDSKKMISLNVHRTELDAKKNSLGDYTVSVIADKDKIKKENVDLRLENKKLATKVDDLENKISVEKINKAHSEFKQTVTMEYIKENNVNNVLGGIGRLLNTILANLKSIVGFVSFLKLM